MANYLAVSKTVGRLFTAGEQAIAHSTAASKPLINMVNKGVSKSLCMSNPTEFINSVTMLGNKASTRLFNYLPQEAQQNFETLLNAGKKLNYIKTDANGNITSKSLERFLTVWDRDSYSKMMFLQDNFKDLNGADFKRIMNAFSSSQKMMAGKRNIERWLAQKDLLVNHSKTLENEAQAAADKARRLIFKLTGFEPECRGKSFQSIYDKLSLSVFSGKDVSSIDAAKKEVLDSIGTRINFKDASPAQMRKFVDGICKGIESKQIEVTRISNYTNDIAPYLSQGHYNRIMESAARVNAKVKVINITGSSSVKSKSGFACAQMNIRFPFGITGESQCRSELMHKYAELEHLFYDVRMGKNISKNIPELERYLEPFEDQIHMLKRNGLSDLHDKYLWDCYNYIRKYEVNASKGIVGEFKLPSYPKKLKQYDLLSFDALKKIHNDIETIKKFAKAA